MDDKATHPETAERPTRRRAYRSPTVTDFGDVEKLTQVVSGYV